MAQQTIHSYREDKVDPNSHEDTILWNNFRSGSEEAFEIIYRKNVNKLYNYGMYLFMDNKLVEDSIHDVFLELWSRKSFLGDTQSIRYYLYKSLKTKILRKLKTTERQSARYSIPDNYDHEYAESLEFELIAGQLLQESSEILSRAVSSLPGRQKEIILHKFYHNRTSEEISTLMSLSIDSTYTLLSRALKELRKNLKYLSVLLLILLNNL